MWVVLGPLLPKFGSLLFEFMRNWEMDYSLPEDLVLYQVYLYPKRVKGNAQPSSENAFLRSRLVCFSYLGENDSKINPYSRSIDRNFSY